MDDDDDFSLFEPKPSATEVAQEAKPIVVRQAREGNPVGNFIKYNNTVPIVLGILFLSTSGALAASPEVRSSVYSSSTAVTSVDNSYIRTVDLAAFPLSIEVTSVTQDSDNYYITYVLHTIDLVNGVWQNTDKPETLTVAIAQLHGEDLGTYASQQLGNVRDAERDRLVRTQKIEQKNGASDKVIATTYAGLVGRLLSGSQTTFPGYVADHGTGVASNPYPTSDPNHLTTPQTETTFNAAAAVAGAAGAPAAGDTNTSSGSASTGSGDTTPPSLNLLGDALVTVTVGSSYTDLGVIVTDNVSPPPPVNTFVDNVPVTTVVIDTSTPGTHTIIYQAQDAAGNHAQISRTVTVIAVDSASSSVPPTPPASDTTDSSDSSDSSDGGSAPPATPPVDTAPPPSSPTPTPPPASSTTQPPSTDDTDAGTAAPSGDSDTSSPPPAASS